MRYGSVCSGIEAASVAWRPLGWDCAFVSELEKFPSAVLAERFPTVPNLGDFTKIEPCDYEGGIDLLVGGTPCQAFSIAGLRKGLNDARGNLALEFARLAFRTAAKWVVWENVPGVLSSGKGGDFAAFLSLLVGWEITPPEGGKWRRAGLVTAAPGCFSVGWRVLDAQYTRVQQFPRAIPQRRKRVILVGSLGSWEDCAKVLFDGEMCGGDLPPRREARQGAAAGAEGGVGHHAGICWWDGSQKADTLTCRSIGQLMPDKHQLPCVVDTRFQEVFGGNVSPSLLATDYKEPKAVIEDVCPTLDASYPGKMNNQDVGKLVCYENHPQDGRIRETDGVSPSIPAQAGTGGNNLPLVQRVFVMDSMGSNAMKSANPKSGFRETDVAQTLDTTVPEPSKNQGGMAIVDAVAIAENIIGRRDDTGGNGVGAQSGVCYTLDTAGVHGVCYPIDMTNLDGRERHLPGKGYDEEDSAAYSLTKRRASGVCTPGVIRRLVPVECERLMGFPDGWTLIPWRGKPADECPDGPRYKALGNSMCTNVMAWIGERIDAVEKEKEHGRQDA
jgi:DNA (cytosine-5)-methyltransferase 1